MNPSIVAYKEMQKMKLNWIGGILFAMVLAIAASAQVGVYIGSAAAAAS
jgi:hypothetical protein